MNNLIKLIPLTLFITSTASLAHADPSYVGTVMFANMHRGSYDQKVYYEGAPTPDFNLCGYNTYTFKFEAYEQGLTDINGIPDPHWNVEVASVQDSTQKTFNSINQDSKELSKDGNNLVFSFPVAPLSPSPVTGLDPKLQDMHLTVTINGKQWLNIPVHFSCTHD